MKIFSIIVTRFTIMKSKFNSEKVSYRDLFKNLFLKKFLWKFFMKNFKTPFFIMVEGTQEDQSAAYMKGQMDDPTFQVKTALSLVKFQTRL